MEHVELMDPNRLQREREREREKEKERGGGKERDTDREDGRDNISMSTLLRRAILQN